MNQNTLTKRQSFLLLKTVTESIEVQRNGSVLSLFVCLGHIDLAKLLIEKGSDV